MIFGINTTRDTSKLSQISKHQPWYLCQISLRIKLLPISIQWAKQQLCACITLFNTPPHCELFLRDWPLTLSLDWRGREIISEKIPSIDFKRKKFLHRVDSFLFTPKKWSQLYSWDWKIYSPTCTLPPSPPPKKAKSSVPSAMFYGSHRYTVTISNIFRTWLWLAKFNWRKISLVCKIKQVLIMAIKFERMAIPIIGDRFHCCHCYYRLRSQLTSQ